MTRKTFRTIFFVLLVAILVWSAALYAAKYILFEIQKEAVIKTAESYLE